MWTIHNLVGTLEFYLPPKCYIYSDLSGLKNNHLQSGVFYISYSPATDWHFKISLKEGHVMYRLIYIEDIYKDGISHLKLKDDLKIENIDSDLIVKYKFQLTIK